MSADDSADNETSETPQESNESASDNTPNTDKPDALSDTEKDAVGEISNISMGTAATTLSSLLNQKVNITTPRVEVADWDKLSIKYDRPCVMLQIWRIFSPTRFYPNKKALETINVSSAPFYLALNAKQLD